MIYVPPGAGLLVCELPKLKVGFGIDSVLPKVGVELFDPKLNPLCAGAGVELELPNPALDPPNEKPGLEVAGELNKEVGSDFCLKGVVFVDPKPPKVAAGAAGSASLFPNENPAVDAGGLSSDVLLLLKENPEAGVDSAGSENQTKTNN